MFVDIEILLLRNLSSSRLSLLAWITTTLRLDPVLSINSAFFLTILSTRHECLGLKDCLKWLRKVSELTTDSQVVVLFNCAWVSSKLDFIVSIATPLTDLSKAGGLKKRPINWTDAWQTSFDMIKSKLVNVALLQAPDTSEPYRVETDASDIGIGAVLLPADDQSVWHPLAYESRKLSSAERNYCPKRGSSWEYSMRYALGDAFWKAAFTRCPLTIIHSSKENSDPDTLLRKDYAEENIRQSDTNGFVTLSSRWFLEWVALCQRVANTQQSFQSGGSDGVVASKLLEAHVYRQSHDLDASRVPIPLEMPPKG
ncbi:hypothetical protein VTP01DRAFT_2231 [Rhizomucor pusillus]|uniref:uncharacterized protein n=1 Tax=Rhizomucor pusillus TaxID=4840 RepID=UPI0037429321